MTTEHRAPTRPRRRHRRVALLVVPLILLACSGPERIEWPGARFDVPAGWELVVQERERLVLADHLADQGERGVLVTFLREPGTVPDDWRRRIEERGATLESDEQVLIAGDVPATQLILRDEIGGTPVREAILVVASRGLVIAISPRIAPGEQDGPELLLESLDGVRGVLDTIELALPAVG